MKRTISNYFLVIDAIILFTIYIFVESLTLQFTFAMVTNISLLGIFALITAYKIVVNKFFNLYKRIWIQASFEDFVSLIYAFTLSNALLFIFIVSGLIPFTILKLLAVMFLEMGWYIFTRFGLRFIKYLNKKKIKGLRNTLVIGAGAAGDLVYREISRDTIAYNLKIVGFIDDDLSKVGRKFKNLPVLGKFSEIAKIIEVYEVSEVIIAIPSLSRTMLASMVDELVPCGVTLKTLPTLTDLEKGSQLKIRDVQIDDLLGREVIRLDDTGVKSFLKEKTVLVTGGGGSIGSEIVRQTLEYGIKKVIIFDIYENNAYDLEQELCLKGIRNIEVIIGSVRDEARLNEVFETYRPEIVFHAAAHKHVPLMETSPNEAIKNNCFGTYNTCKAALAHDVEDFVLISTDKAVNPTNVMGASKRMAELVIQSFNGKGKTTFSAVRFGNVLGSNGSVIPLFKRQIENGGPITVTHKDIIRYFMTIPEAVQLVIQSGVFASGGEIFVLDMGEPMKIVDLAKNMIGLSGLKEGEDIEIVFTGLRPGEKMFEELLLTESHKETNNSRIFIEEANGFKFEIEEVLSKILENYESIFDIIKG